MFKKKRLIIPLCLAVILLLIIFIPKKPGESMLDEIHIIDTIVKEKVVYEYGIPTNEYNIDYGVVKRNQNLSHILQAHGLSAANVYKLVNKCDTVFDVRRIKVGDNYAVFKTLDSIPQIKYFVYERDAKSYVVFDLRGDYNVTLGLRPVEWIADTVAGKIESSLWFAMKDAGAEPQLAVELANIFGWTIDFFGVQKNDKFKIIYEQEFVEDKGLLNFRIKGASFNFSDSTYYAIPFEQDGELLYYHANGHSLEGAFLKAPLDFFRITSKFTNSRFHPVLKRYRAHHGVDYAAPIGTPVYAIGSGKVIAKAYQKNGAGYYLKIKHNSVYTTSYMHLSRFAKGIAIGSVVKQKQVIAYVGSTGLSTGPHLDFRVYENGKAINPLTIKSQPKKPISEENMPAFIAHRDSLISVLSVFPEFIETKQKSE